MDSLDSVLDPSDWTKTKFPPLYQLDSMIRCHICKEFMTSPVLTGCGHCFCSLCIRSTLQSIGKCPLCNDEQIESKLRKNLILEEVIIFFKKYRANLIELLTEDEKVPNGADIGVSSSGSTELITLDSDDDQLEQKPRSKAPAKRSSSPVTQSRKKQKNNLVVSVVDQLTQSQHHSQQSLSECPICHDFFPLHEIETTHIDECLSNGAQKRTETPPVPKKASGISNFFVKKSVSSSSKPAMSFDKDKTFQIQRNPNNNRPLKKLDFTSLPTSKLKEKLSLLSLPTVGTRQQLEARYDQYSILYNSNLDSVNPVPLKQLRSNLNQWEFLNNSMDSNLILTTKQKDINREDWTYTHKDEFSKLIEKARLSNSKKVEESSETQDKAKTDEADEISDVNKTI